MSDSIIDEIRDTKEYWKAYAGELDEVIDERDAANAALAAKVERLREALVEIATWVNLTDTFEIATKALEAGNDN